MRAHLGARRVRRGAHEWAPVEGGGNGRENRITVCAWHHLRGIHAGLVRASGTAPAEVRWELGIRSGNPPLLSFIGDAYVQSEAFLAATREGRAAAA